MDICPCTECQKPARTARERRALFAGLVAGFILNWVAWSLVFAVATCAMGKVSGQ